MAYTNTEILHGSRAGLLHLAKHQGIHLTIFGSSILTHFLGKEFLFWLLVGTGLSVNGLIIEGPRD